MYKNQLAHICNRALKTECIHSNDTDVEKTILVFELSGSVLIQDKSIIQLEESWKHDLKKLNRIIPLSKCQQQISLYAKQPQLSIEKED